MGERRIIVMEGDKKIYEGPENRHSQNVAVVQPTRLFGLNPDTWIKIAGFLMALVIFYYRTEDFMKSQVAINKYVMDFTRNSDGYHSAITGQQFEQGQPNGRMISQARRNLSPLATAHAEEINP
jgi:hypothetical protein